MEIMAGITCYNCELQITRVLKELDAVLDECPWIKKVAVFDNRSKDNTAEAALQCISGLKHRELFSVFRNTVNAGLGGTHKIAFSMAQKENFSHLLIVHGDHQATPADIPALLKVAAENSEPTVLGSRFRDLSLLSGFSKIRIAGNLALNVCYTIGGRRIVSDLGSGINLFRLKDIRLTDIQTMDNGFTFNMDLLLYFIKNRVNFIYVPIRWSTTDQVSNVNAVIIGWKTAKKLVLWMLGIYPNEPAHTETQKLN
ncbi:MAG: hypothetical protein K0R29_1275 [Pseudobdellovibrio sp.]|jgi:glycosyltransferase involved in cell wall biosynthesis|nr:hypothetical protein [Pseudobdellovibrio sp.]